MENFVKYYLGTIIVCILLAVVVFFVIRKMIKDKNGKHNCGCGCEGCVFKDGCKK